MTVPLLYGDQVSCSRVGGVMRRESSRLRQRAQSLEDASHAPDREFGALAAWQGPDADAVRDVIAKAVRALRATAQDLDDAGAALQSYATDLAQAQSSDDERCCGCGEPACSSTGPGSSSPGAPPVRRMPESVVLTCPRSRPGSTWPPPMSVEPGGACDAR